MQERTITTEKEKMAYDNLNEGRCKHCKNAILVKDMVMGYVFLGCYHDPYKGKSVTEIKDCPKKNGGYI